MDRRRPKPCADMEERRFYGCVPAHLGARVQLVDRCDRGITPLTRESLCLALRRNVCGREALLLIPEVHAFRSSLRPVAYRLAAVVPLQLLTPDRGDL